MTRVINEPTERKTFPLWFAAAFLIYAIAWCAFWFGLRGKWRADLWGALTGLAAMTWLFQRVYGRPGIFVRLFVGLFVLHSAGYYGGEALHAALRGPAGKLLWGTAHGLGFGAGIGYVLWHCQSVRKIRLPSAPAA